MSLAVQVRRPPRFSTLFACAKACSFVASSPITSSSFPLSTTVRRQQGVERQPKAGRSNDVGGEGPISGRQPLALVRHDALHAFLTLRPL